MSNEPKSTLLVCYTPGSSMPINTTMTKKELEDEMMFAVKVPENGGVAKLRMEDGNLAFLLMKYIVYWVIRDYQVPNQIAIATPGIADPHTGKPLKVVQ